MCEDRKGTRVRVGDRIYVPPRPHLNPIVNDEGEVLMRPGDRGRVYRIEDHPVRGDIVHFYRLRTAARRAPKRTNAFASTDALQLRN